MSDFKIKISEHLVYLLIPLAFVPILKMSRHSNIKIYKAAFYRNLISSLPPFPIKVYQQDVGQF